ncbi:xanthine dehydrogenase family protein molybdopterin-binding subunit [Larkinella rosea]|uniref:Xanthine dehydrogenase family protein molybdopterin-binding subunit n=1 Tax=Larkinella rosea TaxID=2025312 RepID=A0A3P1C100_9BACT|nr:xanthine dehydrogenase family protein molybdopterin-binding subunit [Larkinella rosea]RRB06918.1 xanthine dehydrogenase family protein molybdopterin-binding subunit [Larkinella rosea]
MRKTASVTRRDFLKSGALAGSGLFISFTIPSRLDSARWPEPYTPAGTQLNAFLRIDSDDTIHIILSKVEMGQGIWTTIPMLIAEELDCDWKKIKVESSQSGKGKDFQQDILIQSTGGSDTTRTEFDRCRQAGATARTLLVNAAAHRLGVSPDACRTENGFVITGSQRMSYGELAAEAAKLPVPNVQLREPPEWKLIGKSQKRLDCYEKINGKAQYGLDIQFPGLLTALVAHAPVFGGNVKAVDATRTKAVPGVRAVVRIPSGVAVLGDNFWAAKRGRDLLKIEWDFGGNDHLNSREQLEKYRNLAKTTGIVSQQKGDLAAGFEKAAHSIDVDFTFPYLAHAPLEPLNCTVKMENNHCEIWTGTQSPLLHQSEVAAFLGIQPEQVTFHTPYIGGSFGRRGSFSSDWVMEAVHIAKNSGRPIKLVWTREDDIKGGFYRPFYVHQVQIGVDSNGFPTAWQHRIVGQSLFTNTPLAEMIVQKGIDYSTVGGVHGSPYLNAVPNHSVELHTTVESVPVLPWRSVGNTHTAFVMETLIDELASLASTDPVNYRRVLLKNHPRHLGALNRAVEISDWDKPLPVGKFRGIAVHAAMGSYVAQVVEISIERQKIRIHRVVCVIDCGLAVNPDGVRAQMESCIVYGLTAALYGEITLGKGQVKQSNFHDYPLLRMNEMPTIEVHIVKSSESMGGAGEPGVPPIAPALANAVFAATGKRVRSLPIRLDS